MTKENGKDIQKAFEEIAKVLVSLGLPKLPATKIILKKTRGTGKNLMGEHIKVMPLSLDPGGLSGSQPTKDSTMGYALKKTYTHKWVAGHLLNHKMHGTGSELWNLTPLSKATNSQMNVKSETPAKKMLLGDGVVLSYEVKVNYKNSLDETADTYPDKQIADSIEMTVKQMEYKNGKWTEMSNQPDWAKNATGRIPHDVDNALRDPNTPTPKIDFNSDNVRMLATLDYVGPTRAKLIMDYRRKAHTLNPNSKPFNDINDLEKAGISKGIIELIKDNNINGYIF